MCFPEDHQYPIRGHGEQQASGPSTDTNRLTAPRNIAELLQPVVSLLVGSRQFCLAQSLLQATAGYAASPDAWQP